MCGIIGYLGKKQSTPLLIEGLHRLEYRGYDSAGIAVVNAEGIHITKTKGRVDDLEAESSKSIIKSTIGIGHTRWATHGIPNKINAHPHLSADGSIALVHNGIIENYAQIKEGLLKKGVIFKSQTDTEVLANLIATIQKEQKISTFAAVQAALALVRGAYAIAVLNNEDTDTLVVAKKSSPLAIGIGENEFIVGSDATPIVAHTQQVIYINDDEVVELHRDGTYNIVSLLGTKVSPEVLKIDIDLDKLEKGGYAHFMLKEISEQPEVIRNTMRGRLSLDQSTVMLGGIIDYEQRILRAPKLTIVACGTSWNAGLLGKYIIEELAGIPVEVEYASEFRYRKSPLNENDVILAISQSGETADTLAAVELANKHKALTLGLVNNVGSSIARATCAGVYTHAGPEISVASTKAFSAQVTALTLMAFRFAQQLGTIQKSELQKLYQQFAQLPSWVEETLETKKKAQDISKYIAGQKIVLFLGRNKCYPVALEGALKLKEISYIASEGYPAGEMKHGPIALVNKGTPVFVIIPTETELKDKIISSIQEIKARGAYVIAIGDGKDKEINKSIDELLQIPSVPDLFLPVVATTPLQFIAYYSALTLGNDVDKPRNLAKSVTVE